ncbi:hypothetical protein ACJX0J_003644 (mitochondrion) [Zea mays]
MCSLGLRSIKGLRVSNQSNFLITKLSRVLHPMNKEKPDSIIQTILHYYNDMFHIGNPFNPFHEYKGLRHLQRALENIAIVRLGTYVTFVNYSTSILEAYDAVNMLAVKKVVPVKRGWIVAFILGGKGITFLS